jgi:hypothetical protein
VKGTLKLREKMLSAETKVIAFSAIIQISRKKIIHEPESESQILCIL